MSKDPISSDALLRFQERLSKNSEEGKKKPIEDIRLTVTHSNTQVIVDFGTKVNWIGMLPDEAIAIAKGILKHAGLVKATRKHSDVQ